MKKINQYKVELIKIYSDVYQDPQEVDQLVSQSLQAHTMASKDIIHHLKTRNHDSQQ